MAAAAAALSSAATAVAALAWSPLVLRTARSGLRPHIVISCLQARRRMASMAAAAVQPSPALSGHAAGAAIVTREGAAACSVQGRRPTNEDRFVCAEVQPNMRMHAVFDGHGGSHAAEVAHNSILDLFRERLQQLRQQQPASMATATALHRAVREALRLALADVDARIRELASSDLIARSGSTATVSILTPEAITVASIGDSQALLLRRGEMVPLSQPHRPDRRDEMERIQGAGGKVIFSRSVPRVNGVLALSRSLGALHMRPFGVIAEPELSTTAVDAASDTCLVLATDGLTDWARREEMADACLKSDSPEEAAQQLEDLAFSHHTNDNVTVVVVRLPAWGRAASSAVSSTAFRTPLRRSA
eukprot:m.105006 g.105006  ORF g.105006 m.105006 type:complete len:362 (-) comp15777_c0_seq1:1152-2237(-)